MPIFRRKLEVSNYDLFVCVNVYNRKRLQMENIAERIQKLAHDLCQIQ